MAGPKWTADEDIDLIKLVDEYGAYHPWREIAEMLNEEWDNGRSGHACMYRFNSYDEEGTKDSMKDSK